MKDFDWGENMTQIAFCQNWQGQVQGLKRWFLIA
jgi:hypothetical protein